MPCKGPSVRTGFEFSIGAGGLCYGQVFGESNHIEQRRAVFFETGQKKLRKLHGRYLFGSNQNAQLSHRIIRQTVAYRQVGSNLWSNGT